MFDLDNALSTCEIAVKDTVPTITHQPTLFSAVKAEPATQSLYGLAHALFDEYDDEFSLGLNKPQRRKYAHRIRRDRVSQWLSKEINEKHTNNLKELEKEDRTTAAVLHLTAHNVTQACDLLMAEGNHRLCLLVAQLDGADKLFMDDIKHQIDAWRKQKALSEMTEEIRTLYEICAGNVTVCKGSEKGATPEDEATTFSISEKYHLSWLQCFSLGLFYGRDEKTGSDGISRIEDAVREYQNRIDSSEEATHPGNDPVWTLLRLYASRQADTKDLIASPSFPADLIGLSSRWNSSSIFAFYHAITANISNLNIDITKSDLLASTLAYELASKHDLASAIFALLHLSSPSARHDTITSLLNSFARTLPGADTATTPSGIALWQTLTMQLKLPQSWLYIAKARYAASPAGGIDNNSELRYLVAAERWSEAHECFLKRVAPGLVVDEDWQTLLDMCTLFGSDPAVRVSDWADGGSLFNDFAQLMTKVKGSDSAVALASIRTRLIRLGKSLSKKDGRKSVVHLGQLSKHELEECVAIKEMSNSLARMVGEGVEVGSKEELLAMPVTSDVRLMLETGMLHAAGGNKHRSGPRDEDADMIDDEAGRLVRPSTDT